MRYGSFRVIKWMALSSTIQARDGWIAWAGNVSPASDFPGEIEPAPAILPPILRRRVTPVGQLALRVAQCLEPADETPVILCSRHGEFSRTLALIEAVAAGEATSPAEFALSVHHALAGLFSIAQKNMAGHTAIAAGPDTFGCGMLEALGCLAAQPEQPVLLIYYDEALPGPYAELEDASREAEFALALLLSSATGDGDLTLTATPAMAPSGIEAVQQAKDFLSFVLTRRVELASPGQRTNWHWRRAA